MVTPIIGGMNIMKDQAVEPYLMISLPSGENSFLRCGKIAAISRKENAISKTRTYFLLYLFFKKSTEKCIPYNTRPLAPLSFLPSMLPCCPEACSPSSRYRKTITPTWMSSSHEPQIYSSSNFSVTSKCPLHLFGFSGPHALKSCLPLCM